jgi:hypothetical protein
VLEQTAEVTSLWLASDVDSRIVTPDVHWKINYIFEMHVVVERTQPIVLGIVVGYFTLTICAQLVWKKIMQQFGIVCTDFIVFFDIT